mgnify:CR=1 FL=1
MEKPVNMQMEPCTDPLKELELYIQNEDRGCKKQKGPDGGCVMNNGMAPDNIKLVCVDKTLGLPDDAKFSLLFKDTQRWIKDLEDTYGRKKMLDIIEMTEQELQVWKEYSSSMKINHYKIMFYIREHIKNFKKGNEEILRRCVEKKEDKMGFVLNWKKRKNKNGDTFYVNDIAKTWRWSHP